MTVKDTTAWLDKVAAQTDAAEAALPEGPVKYRPHAESGESDGSYLYADLMAEPDLPEA